MKIGIFGNTNNYPLLLALGLRELGHVVQLIVNRKEPLHRPEAKFPELQGRYPGWIHDCSDISEDDFIAATPRIGGVLNALTSSAEALILNDIGPSLLAFCPLPAVAFLTGSDVTYYADPRTLDVRQQAWSDDYKRSPGGRLAARVWTQFVDRQRAGIRDAVAVSAPFPGLVPVMDSLLREIGVADARRDFFCCADTRNAPARQRRATPPLRIVNGARLNWKKPLPAGFCSQDHKGTDVLLQGFAEFLAAGGDAELVMFRKGLHVAETEALANTLGVETRIAWRNEVTLREFYREIAAADIICDQLGDSFPGMVAADAMAMGVPVIARFPDEIYGRHFPEPMPVHQARSAADVAAHLAALSRSEGDRVRAGLSAKKFARAYLSPAANAARCLHHLGVH